MKRRKTLPEPDRRDSAVAGWWFVLAVLGTTCVLLDVFLIGMPLLGLSLLGVVVAALVLQAGWRWFGRRRRAALRSGLRALMLAACALVSFFICQAQVAAGRHAAHDIAAALEAYHQRHGRFPDDLRALVPEQLAALPATGSSFSDAAFDYALDADGRPRLGWTIHALGGRARYDFETGLVRFHD